MIFNSLGSNYDLERARRLAKVKGTLASKKALIEAVSKWLGGREVELYYKGREALEVGLRRTKLPAGSNVAINGLTCYVVEKAVLSAGLKPVFVDVAQESLNFDLASLENAHKKTPFSAVILQNTLGYSMRDLEAIVSWARKQKILIVEDLAHSFGAEYLSGGRAGTLGDMGIISFSRDKGFDVVSGGALFYKKGLLKKMEVEILGISKQQERKDRLYAIRTWLIRKTLWCGAGRILYKVWRKSGALLSPMKYDGDDQINQMPVWMAEEAVRIWRTEWQDTLWRRRRVAKEYSLHIVKDLQVNDVADVERAAALRFPIILKNEVTRARLIKFLARHSVMLSDIFFDTVAAPKRLQHLSSYKKGSCPNAEDVADRIFNLPTHINVSDRGMQKIIRLINRFNEESK